MPEELLTFEELKTAAEPAKPAESPVSAAATEPQPAIEAAPDQPQFTDADVATYREYVDLGITPAAAREALQAKADLNAIGLNLVNNPRAIIDQLWKTNPTVAKQFEKVASDSWWEHQGQQEYEAQQRQQSGSGSRTTTSTTVDPRIDELQAKYDSLIEERNQEKSARQQEIMQANFTGSIDSLLKKLPESVPEDKRDYIRLKTMELAWKDKGTQARVSKGDYTDLSKHFASASKLVSAETKVTSEAERDRRETVKNRATKEIIPGAENVAGSAADDGPSKDPIWGNINENEIRSAYK